MAAEKKARRKLARELQEARAEHDKLLKRVEKARAKFEKRSGKLTALEQEIAELEKRYYEPAAERMGQADAAKDGARTARLIYSPEAGQANDSNQQLTELIGILRGHGIAADVQVKTSGQSARDLAREAAAQGEELVVVAGGDDLVEEVAPELVGSKTALGIIPTGTNNNLARALGIPAHLDPACALVGMGITRLVDVGQLTDGHGQQEYFLETVGAGFGSNDEQDQSNSLPRALRRFDLRPARLEIETESGETQTPIGSAITVSNAPLMGRNLPVAPEAKMDDGLLDVVTFEGMNEQQVLDYLNRSSDQPDDRVKHLRARRVKIESSGEEPGTGQGGANSPELDIKVLPQALAIIVGNGPALSFPVQAGPADQDENPNNGGSNGKRGTSSFPIIGLFRGDSAGQP